MVSADKQARLLEEIGKHGGTDVDLETVEGLREFVKEADIIERNPKSGSVPSLNNVISSEQRQLLVEDVFPESLRDDEKTMWYLGKLNDIGASSMIPVEKYQSNKKKILHKCFICGYEVSAPPSRVETNAKRDRRGCDGCNHRNGTSVEEAQRLFRYKRPDIVPLSGYSTKFDPIKVRCAECGHEWESKAHYLLLDGPTRSGCPECGKNVSRRAGNKTKTTEQFRKELASISPDIEVVGEYVNSKTKIRLRHSCGHEWEASPNKLLKGQGCPKCNKPHRMSHEEYLLRLSDEGIEYEPLAKFAGVDVKIPHRCPECGQSWDISPYNVLLGYGCPVCRAGRVNYSREELCIEIQRIDSEIEPVEDFKGMNVPIKFECHRQADHFWMSTPYNLFRKTWDSKDKTQVQRVLCPICNKSQSYPEAALYYYLDKMLPEDVLCNPKIICPDENFAFEADIFIPALKLFVEYDGGHWHSDPEAIKRYENREKLIYKYHCKCIHICEYSKRHPLDELKQKWMREKPIAVKNHDTTVANKRRGIRRMILDLMTRIEYKSDLIPDPFHEEIQVREVAWNQRRKETVILTKNEILVTANNINDDKQGE